MWQKFLKAVPMPLVIITKDGGRLMQANDAARGYFGAKLAAGSTLLADYFNRRDWDKLISILDSAGEVWGFESRIRLADGVERDVILAATTVEITDAETILTLFADITSRKQLEALMKRMAHTDPLTGLPNRISFFARAADEIYRARRYERPLSVFMIDIDYFKRVNDTYGHEAGDSTLKAFAQLCCEWIRQQDTMARLGGEEFGVLLPETDVASALALADRLRAVAEGLRIGNSSDHLTISIGVSEVLPDETTADAALSRADQALYSAKRAGRNLAVLYKDVESVL
jgi:diguanylate cyclase